ncbi:hypothetical protein DPEC_G00196990 [Dallia pectoralis]|uniref:Uncharacterized protein n=1 Tax=Dallia pectoralis TaxID=75939 RepID=A0ACC2G7R9_DALPE|nr:hypothetical protein DPEC_G00196990 [Dallia pectoralis]
MELEKRRNDRTQPASSSPAEGNTQVTRAGLNKMTMRGSVMCCVLLVCLVAMLVKQVEGHVSFFSPKEMREMKDQKNKGRKDMEPQTLDGQLQDVTIKNLREVASEIPDKIVEIAKQLEHVGPVLEEIINEMVEEAE